MSRPPAAPAGAPSLAAVPVAPRWLSDSRRRQRVVYNWLERLAPIDAWARGFGRGAISSSGPPACGVGRYFVHRNAHHASGSKSLGGETDVEAVAAEVATTVAAVWSHVPVLGADAAANRGARVGSAAAYDSLLFPGSSAATAPSSEDMLRAFRTAQQEYEQLWRTQRQPNERHMQRLSDARVALSRAAKRDVMLCRFCSGAMLGVREESHEAHHLLQEAGILCALQSALMGAAAGASRRPDVVVDIGGGNGILAWMAAALVGGAAVVVDPFVPPRRVELDVAAGDAHFRRVAKGALQVDLFRDVLGGSGPVPWVLVSKHLCGGGLDDALRMIDTLPLRLWPQVMTLSSCCHHKSAGAQQYINPAYLRAMRIVSAPHSCDDAPPRGGGSASSSDLESISFQQIANATSWLAPQNPPWARALGRQLEELLDWGRVLWLRERGYAASMRPFVPPFVTERNRILVATRAPRLTR